MVYWGRNIVDTVNQWRVFDWIDSNLEVALQESGIRSFLWFPLQSGWKCSCVRSGTPDVMCVSCYGTGLVGGYVKYNNYYIVISPVNLTDAFVAFDHNTFIVVPNAVNYNTNEIKIITDILPYRVTLQPGVLSSVMESIDFTVPEDIKNLEYDLQWFSKDHDIGNSNVYLEVNVNNTGWVSADTLVGSSLNKNDSVKLRLTISRDSDEIRGPFVEILRLRGSLLDDTAILVSRARRPENLALEKKGLLETEANPSYWTLLEEEIIPRCFLQLLQSPFVDDRYELFNFNRSFWKDRRFRQIFDARRISRDREIFWKVF